MLAPAPSVLNRVAVTGIGSFLPNEPVPTAQITAVLGSIDQAPPEVQTFGARFARKFADRCGVEFRHFAIDPATGRMTHTIVTLGVEAANRALAAAGVAAQDVDMLLISTPLADAATPPTSALLQDALGITNCIEMEIHSNCSGLFKCIQIAADALRLGRCRRALVVYSQISSAYLRTAYYNQSKMTKTQAALRYILTDGAGALVLEAKPAGTDPLPGELLGTYLESVGTNRPPAMTGGGGLADLAAFGNYREIYEQGTHHLDQDLVLVSREAPAYLLDSLRRHVAAVGLPADSIHHLVASVPSVQQYEDNTKRFLEHFPALILATEFPYRNSGYCGGAAVLVSLDDLIRSGNLKRGQIALIHAVESSKWMAGGFAVKW